MSPTVFRHGPYRFFFFSREEQRMHVHVYSPDGEAKFWLEPEISMANNYGFRTGPLSQLQRLVEEHRDELIEAWNGHFGG
jgi:hypothetical protein